MSWLVVPLENGDAAIQSVVADLHLGSQSRCQGIHPPLHALHVHLEEIMKLATVVTPSLRDGVDTARQLVKTRVDLGHEWIDTLIGSCYFLCELHYGAPFYIVARACVVPETFPCVLAMVAAERCRLCDVGDVRE